MLATPPASAQQPAPEDEAPQTDRAAELKAEGDVFMDNLDFKKAFDLYTQAYAISKDPVLLYNSGRALQGLNRYPEALDNLEQFRREASPELMQRVPGLDELIAKVQAQVATLEIQCNVSGARVLLDGKMVGTTPLTPRRVNAGATKIEVFKDGHTPASMTVKLEGNKTRKLDFELIQATPTGLLVVKSNAPGATVTVDQRDLGVAPTQTELASGEHSVQVQHPDYEPYETTVVVKVGASTTIDATLEESPAVYERWWFWTIAGAIVAGGAVTGAVLAATIERDPDTGDIPPGQVATPFRMAPARPTVGLMLPALRF